MIFCHCPFFFLIFVPTCLAAYQHDLPPSPVRFATELPEKKDSRLSAADALYEAGLYSKASTAYQQLLDDLAKQTAAMDSSDAQFAMQIRLHLAHTYYVLGQYASALPLLKENAEEFPPISNGSQTTYLNSLYLSALIYKQLEQYPLAIETFRRYLKNDPSSLDLSQEAEFEIGLLFFLMKNFDEAKKHLTQLNFQKINPRLYFLTHIYLSRISLSEGNARESLNILAKLPPLSPNDPLAFELSYLQGEAYFQLHDYAKAIQFFDRSMPKEQPRNTPWYSDTLYYLGWSYLEKGNDPRETIASQSRLLNKAEEYFQKLLSFKPEERGYLALAQCYLTCAKHLDQESAYQKAEKLLTTPDIIQSLEGQTHALLLLADAASSYADRDNFYRQLTLESNHDSPFYPEGWYLRALNDYKHAQTLLDKGEDENAISRFDQSAQGFRKAFDLLKDTQAAKAGVALKYEALAISQRKNQSSYLQAYNLLEELIDNQKVWKAMDSPEEILYLKGFFASRLVDDQKFTSIADSALRAAAQYPESHFGDISLNYLAAIYYNKGNPAEAEKIYLQLAEQYPSSIHAGEAWFWSACCADHLNKESVLGKERRQKVFEKYPDSPYAPEAYFTFYTYSDYLQGDRQALKHLQNFIAKYPDSPFIIEAFYLIGLDFKRDRKNPDGKWLRKRSLTDAIDAFQEVETNFDRLAEKSLIPPSKMEYYIDIRYRATLERAMANLAISDESQGAKRQIYLQYAEEVFSSLNDDFNTPNHHYTKYLTATNAFPPLQEESTFWLALTFIRAQNDAAAEKILEKMVERYRLEKVTRGYYLSRVWYEKAQISQRRKDFTNALQMLKYAEEAAKGHHILSTDQRLDLWIQQSMSYRGLQQYDNAILILSKVVNDDAISSLRLKAMFLRAEIYELQGRPELARKQLESMAKKGGEWAFKAQEKLGKEYGY